MSFIEDKIREASQRYYTDGTSGISDPEFDSMLDALEKENPDSELLTAVGHGYDVNLDTTPGERVKNLYKSAGSLSKAYTWSDFNKSIASGDELHASLKLDGMSVVLYYKDGYLIRAVTRGDIGIDITDKVIHIISTKINDSKFTGAVRGEILMTDSQFEEFKIHNPEAENSRNSTAGILNRGEPTDDLDYLKIVVYTVEGLVNSKTLDIDNLNRRSIQAWLNANFTAVVPFDTIWISKENYLDEMLRLHDKWSSDVTDYPSDGIVLSDMSVQVAPADCEIPYANAMPAYKIIYDSQAFKFKSETAETSVVGVEWNLTKTRYLMPTVLLEPVRLAGTTVKRATGYNAKYILDNSIDTGAVVEVEKRGEIIPNLNKVIKPANVFILPTVCPSCGSILAWSGVHLKCNNPICGNATMQDNIIWLKSLVPVDGMGDILIAKFIKQIFGESATVETITEAAGYFNTRAGTQFRQFEKMLYNLHCSRFSLKSALIALNIPRLGELTSEKLSKHPECVKRILRSTNSLEASIEARKVLGQADSESIYRNFTKFQRLNLIYDQIDWNEEPFMNIPERGQVVITGKLSVSRSKFEEELRSYGYSVSSNVSKNTDFLITDDPDSGSSKNIKADKLGVTKITETYFRSKYMK